MSSKLKWASSSGTAIEKGSERTLFLRRPPIVLFNGLRLWKVVEKRVADVAPTSKRSQALLKNKRVGRSRVSAGS